jgi:hypothetical protein
LSVSRTRKTQPTISPAFALRVEILQERADDLGGDRFDVVVPAVFAGVKRAVLLDHPAHVAGTVRAQRYFQLFRLLSDQ